jgi:type I restriction enzyme, S subunit
MIATAVENTKTAWLGEFPEHWEVLRIKNVATVNDEALSESTNPDLSIKYIDIGNVNSDGEINEIQEFKFSDAPSRARRVLRKGDVIISTVRTYLKAITQISFDVENHIASTGFAVLRPKDNILSDYLSYAVRAKYFIDSIMVNSFGVSYPAINSSVLVTLPILVPPKTEQDEIVQYIKAQEEKINLFIQKKQRLIELLKEQRQIIIHQVVTKGLNQKVKLKSSGIEWLGDIPTHWEIRRLKECLIGKLKYGANESGEEYNPTWYRYIRITDFSLDGKLSEENKLSLSPEIGAEYELQEGDILFARSGATVGKTFQFHYVSEEEKYCYAGYLIKATPDENIILSDFLFNYTNSKAFENWKNSIFNKATIENIGADKYSVLKIPIPPIEEQKQIIAHIKTETATIDTAIAKAEREIELIREYKEAMIAEAVMGKRKL